MNPRHDLIDVISRFRIEGEVIEVVSFGSGHINDTYRSTIRSNTGLGHYIHQQINQKVFRHPEQLMDNIDRVTALLQAQISAAGGNSERDTLNLVPAVDNLSYYRDPDNNYWRTYLFIEGARTFDVVSRPDQVYGAARAFGSFQKMIADLPGERLHETIPDFHHTPRRFDAFQEVLNRDPMNRAVSVKKEIDFLLDRENELSVLVDLLDSGDIPERITHNDTKINNVMFDDITGKGICVIDLDTVMPGIAMYDFGDSVRYSTNPAAEDEQDLSKVCMDLTLFELFARGYLEEVRDFLSPGEIELLSFSARLMALEGGMRFLADHIAGDVYFKIHKKHHNLHRSRTQLSMAADMEEKMRQMERIIKTYA